jgi:hypothetical protein
VWKIRSQATRRDFADSSKSFVMTWATATNAAQAARGTGISDVSRFVQIWQVVFRRDTTRWRRRSDISVTTAACWRRDSRMFSSIRLNIKWFILISNGLQRRRQNDTSRENSENSKNFSKRWQREIFLKLHCDVELSEAEDRSKKFRLETPFTRRKTKNTADAYSIIFEISARASRFGLLTRRQHQRAEK